MESQLSEDEWGAWWIVKGLLNPNPETRYTAQQALQAPTLQGLDKKSQAESFRELKAEELGHRSPTKMQLPKRKWGFLHNPSKSTNPDFGRVITN